MSDRRSTVSRIVFGVAAFVALVCAVMLPFHHHASELGDRDSCAICSLAHQPWLSETIAVAVPLVAAILLSVVLRVFALPSYVGPVHLRSPPRA